MKTLKIQVTKADIDVGSPCSSSFCPIARACHRAGMDKFMIGKTGIKPVSYEIPYDRLEEYHLDLPAAAINFIEAFDHGKSVKPFEFNIEVPDWYYA